MYVLHLMVQLVNFVMLVYCYLLTGDHNWTEKLIDDSKNTYRIEGLQPEVLYEMVVIAKSGNTKDSPEKSSEVQQVGQL